MPAFQRAAQQCLTPAHQQSATRRRQVRRAAIRGGIPLIALSTVFFLTPTAAWGAEAAAGTSSANPLFWGLDLAAVLWLLVGVLAVAAGLLAGSRAVAGPAAAIAPATAGAGLSAVAPVSGQSSSGTRQAAGNNDDPNGA
jgi:hypothetical protein